MPKVIVDKLMDLCHDHAEQIAEQWYKSLTTNVRTADCTKLPREGAIRHAVDMYKNMGKMYFAEDCFKAVEQVLDSGGLVEDFFARGISLEENIYALILMRRHIWLYADFQALFNLNVNDMYNAVDSLNRVLLVFDYATYITAAKYHQLRIMADK